MKLPLSLLTIAAFAALPSPVMADSSDDFSAVSNSSKADKELPPYLQCVPYARQVSGIQIYGDAYTWWQQAAGKFMRGNVPRRGAVMAFAPYRNMQLGHVAAVSKVIDSRTVLLRHSNWSPINGRRGQIEDDVKAVDVSPDNDWSTVRVWYDPLQALGKTEWPVQGFIYNKKSTLGGQGPLRTDSARAVQSEPAGMEPSKEFLSAFSELGKPAKVAKESRTSTARTQTIRTPKSKEAKRYDPVAAAIARYDK